MSIQKRKSGGEIYVSVLFILALMLVVLSLSFVSAANKPIKAWDIYITLQEESSAKYLSVNGEGTPLTDGVNANRGIVGNELEQFYLRPMYADNTINYASRGQSVTSGEYVSFVFIKKDTALMYIDSGWIHGSGLASQDGEGGTVLKLQIFKDGGNAGDEILCGDKVYFKDPNENKYLDIDFGQSHNPAQRGNGLNRFYIYEADGGCSSTETPENGIKSWDLTGEPIQHTLFDQLSTQNNGNGVGKMHSYTCSVGYLPVGLTQNYDGEYVGDVCLICAKYNIVNGKIKIDTTDKKYIGGNCQSEINPLYCPIKGGKQTVMVDIGGMVDKAGTKPLTKSIKDYARSYKPYCLPINPDTGEIEGERTGGECEVGQVMVGFTHADGLIFEQQCSAWESVWFGSDKKDQKIVDDNCCFDPWNDCEDKSCLSPNTKCERCGPFGAICRTGKDHRDFTTNSRGASPICQAYEVKSSLLSCGNGVCDANEDCTCIDCDKQKAKCSEGQVCDYTQTNCVDATCTCDFADSCGKPVEGTSCAGTCTSANGGKCSTGTCDASGACSVVPAGTCPSGLDSECTADYAGQPRHFYTVDKAERNSDASGRFVYEGIAGYVYSTEVAGTERLYRQKNNVTKDHFYTVTTSGVSTAEGLGYVNETQEAYVLATTAQVCCETTLVTDPPVVSYDWVHLASDCALPADWVGASKKLVDSSLCSSIEQTVTPLYRLYKGDRGHFYTWDVAEKDSAVAMGYTPEGNEGNVLLKQIDGTVPLYRLYYPGKTCDAVTKNCVSNKYVNPCTVDGEQTATENCDDGNLINDDACSNNCISKACVEPGKLYQCPDGSCVTNAADCQPITPSGCTPNKVCDSGENCDCPDCHGYKDSCSGADQVCSFISKTCVTCESLGLAFSAASDATTPFLGTCTFDPSYPKVTITKPVKSDDPDNWEEYKVGEEITIEATMDNKRKDLMAEWDFGDNNKTVITNCLTTNVGKCAKLYHTYSTKGAYTIKVNVSEMGGEKFAVDHTSVFAYMVGPNPMAIITQPKFGDVIPDNNSVKFNASESFVADCVSPYTTCTAPSYEVGTSDKLCCTKLANPSDATAGYKFHFEWTFTDFGTEGASTPVTIKGTWADDYSKVVDFSWAFITPGVHTAKLRVGYEKIV